MSYKPRFLSWAKSYDGEVKEFRELIQGNPADVELLKVEYGSLTGDEYQEIDGEEF